MTAPARIFRNWLENFTIFVSFTTQACEPQFKQIQDDSFQKAKQKLEMVSVVTKDTIDLKERVESLRDELDLLMQKLMSDERKWETIMMMQVVVATFYHLRLIENFACYTTLINLF